jgi:hypothetical protein
VKSGRLQGAILINQAQVVPFVLTTASENLNIKKRTPKKPQRQKKTDKIHSQFPA